MALLQTWILLVMEEKACTIFSQQQQQQQKKGIRNSRKNYNSKKLSYKYEREQK